MQDTTASSLPNLEEVTSKHRKELRDLQSRITQKKKNATKKNRKAVNDECAALENDVKLRHAAEIACLSNTDSPNGPATDGTRIDAESDELVDAILRSNISEEHQTKHVDDAAAAPQHSGIQCEPAQIRKPNRQKARLARRAAEQEAESAKAAEEAEALPDLKALEAEKMRARIKEHNLTEHAVAANGHCLYLAVADQLKQLKLPLGAGATHQDIPDFKLVRSATADYMQRHSDDFAPFLEEPLDEYLHKIRETGEWGGQLELLALAKTYRVNINVLQADGRIEKFEGLGEDPLPQAWLAFHRHSFGLGEHYNSLRKIS